MGGESADRGARTGHRGGTEKETGRGARRHGRRARNRQAAAPLRFHNALLSERGDPLPGGGSPLRSELIIAIMNPPPRVGYG